jgi:hypothetical protein
VRLAKKLRRALKLKLPESVKLAKLCLRFEEVRSPFFVLLRECADGCCTGVGLETPGGRLTSRELRALVEAA